MGFDKSSKTSSRILPFLIALFAAPSAALASDPTPLFVLFIEIPVLGFSLLFLVVCFFAPRAGVALVILLLIGSLFVLSWASEVGYMSTAGELLQVSLVIDMIGFFVAVKKIKEPPKTASDESK